MKKILLILGILAYVLPAVSDDSVPTQPAEPKGLDVSELIQAKDDIEEGCSGEVFQGDYTVEHPLQMAAVYVDGCPNETDEQNNEIGKYLRVADDASIGDDGTLSGVSCEWCPMGHECQGIDYNKIEIKNGWLSSQGAKKCDTGMYSDEEGLAECKYCELGTYQDTEGADECKPVSDHYYAVGLKVNDGGATGQELCPTGYQDGTGASSIYGCQKLITSCTDYTENFTTGTMTAATLPSGGLTANYRDLDNHCFGSLECNAGYNKTAENSNAYRWILENSEKVTENVRCPISGVIGGEVYNSDIQAYEYVEAPCNNGQEPGTIKWTLEGENIPMASANFVAVCSNETGAYTNNILTAESTGSNCYVRNVDFPNQPWLRLNNTVYNNIAECETRCGEDIVNKNEYPRPLVNGLWEDGIKKYLIVKENGTDDYYAKNGKTFIPVVRVTTNKCYDSETGETYDNITTEAACGDAGYKWSGATSAFIVNAAPVDDLDDGTYTYVLYDKMSQFLTDSAQLTTNDTNVKICTPNSITIAWGDVTLEQNDPVRTCTYGGGLITPDDEPIIDENEPKLFLGWKPVVVTSGD